MCYIFMVMCRVKSPGQKSGQVLHFYGNVQDEVTRTEEWTSVTFLW